MKTLEQIIKERLKRALDNGSGFTFEQEDMILLGAKMGQEAISEIGIDGAKLYWVHDSGEEVIEDEYFPETFKDKPEWTRTVEHAPVAAQILQLKQEIANKDDRIRVLERYINDHGIPNATALMDESAELKEQLKLERAKAISRHEMLATIQPEKHKAALSRIKELSTENAELKQWRSEDQTALERKDHEILKLQQRVKELEAENQRLRDFLEGLNEMYPDFIEKTLVVEDREGFFELLNKEKAGE